ncbi:MAG: hypothetical protein RIQ81_2270 [Pseudomonadota bacterium]
MAGLFESVTRVAIEEIIRNHAQTSKFGYVLTEAAFQDMTDDLFNLLLASRELKAAGDRLTGAALQAPPRIPGKSVTR